MKQNLLYRVLKEIYPGIILFSLYVSGVMNLASVTGVYLLFCFYCYCTSFTVFYYNKNSENASAKEAIVKKLEKYQYIPHFLFPTCLLQTILHPFIHYPKHFDFIREDVNEYGTHIDWAETKVELASKSYSHHHSSGRRRLLIILPGLVGDGNNPYVCNLTQLAMEQNYKVVVFQYRLLSDTLKFAEEGFYSLTDDFDQTVAYIEEKYPEYDLYAVGHSYGANTLVNYIGQRNEKKGKKRVIAAVSVSNGFNFPVVEEGIRDTLYGSILTDLLQNKLRQVYKKDSLILPKHIKFDYHRAENCRRFREFDDSITSRAMGYPGVDAYYKDISSYQHIKKANVPLLCLNSEDDQISINEAIPYNECKASENVILAITKYGGHISWIDNSHFFTLKQWQPDIIMEFLNSH